MVRFFLTLLLAFLCHSQVASAEQSKPKTKHEILENLRQNPPAELKTTIKALKPYNTKGIIEKNSKLEFYVRDIPDGPGLFNIFWVAEYSKSQNLTQDIIGIIDPLFAVIRLYMVDNSKGAIAAIDEIGICSIPIDFRPWQLHQKGDKIEIESMPMPISLRDVQNAKTGDFSNKLYSIDREFIRRNLKAFSKSLSKLNASESGNGLPWFPAENVQCGNLLNQDNKPLQSSPIKYQKLQTGEASQIEIIKSQNKSILAQSSKDGSDLLFAFDLGDIDKGNLVWLGESQKTDDGIVKLKQRLVFYDEKNAAIWERFFDETNIRYKLPLRPIMALPSGNILSIGENKTPSGKKSYAIFSCGNPLDASKGQQVNYELCGQKDFEDPSSLNPNSKGKPVIASKPQKPFSIALGTLNEDQIFANMESHLNVTWRVNTKNLPPACRKSKGCITPQSKNAYVPLKSMRLTNGEYTHVGTPYAQADISVANGFLKIVQSQQKDETDFSNNGQDNNYFTNSLSEIMLGGKKTPGNLNDYWAHDYGIDCSAFLQTAWGGGELSGRTNTAALQKGNFGLACQNRVENLSALRPGDAIGVRIDGGPNHVVILANEYYFDGANLSWLVYESASSCDGVCISTYEPTFFNGWGLYRAKNRSDLACPEGAGSKNILANPIPTNKAGWAKKTKSKDGQ